MRRVLLILAVVLLALPAYAQRVQSDRGPSEAIPVRCVNTLGTTFESCGGSGAAGTDVNIQGVGGNPIVGGDLPVKFTVPQHVIVDSAPAGGSGMTDAEFAAHLPLSVTFTNTSLAVTNTGTFAVQAAQSGTWNIGSVTTLPAVTFASPQHMICDSGCAAGAPGQQTMANSSPVVIASDQASFPVAATLAAETTKVIGTVNQGTNPWGVSLAAETTKVIGTVNQGTNPWTVNLIAGFALSATQTDRTQKTQITDGTRDGTVKAASTLPLLTDTAVVTTQRDPLPAGTNVLGHVIVDTASTTAVTQATATNLNAAVVGTGTAGTPAGNILTVQGVASMTKFLVTPDSVALPANQSVNVAQMGGVATSMNTGVRDTGTQRVTIATNDIVPASQSGTWTVQPGNTANTTAWLMNVGQFGGTNVVTGTGASGSGIPRVTVANDSNVIITPPTLTKGTQGAQGFSIQRLNDAGRNTRIFMLDAFVAAPAVEAVQTVVQWYGNAAVVGTTQPAVVPAGKTLRLTGWRITYRSIATFGSAIVRIRVNTAGLGVLASPLVASFEAGSNLGATTVAIVGAVTTESGEFPEGLEIPAAAGVAFSMAGYGPTGTLTLEGPTRFEVHGYEY